MTWLWWGLPAALVLYWIVRKAMIPSMSGAIEAARQQQKVTPIVEQVSKLRPAAQPTAYNHAIRRLWDSYERELAIDLIKVLAEKHHQALIAQYWLKQVLQVEPEMARRSLSREFLQNHFQPEVAAQCGPVG
jgi:hypothetical protein